jgi:hypothetical protein
VRFERAIDGLPDGKIVIEGHELLAVQLDRRQRAAARQPMGRMRDEHHRLGTERQDLDGARARRVR